jgi:aquaporin Z
MTVAERRNYFLCNMRLMPIQIVTGKRGIVQLKASWTTNWKHYLQEALGLAIFMLSACFFGAMLEGNTLWHEAVPNAFTRTILMGLLMGATALIIFYSSFTAPSGAHINPAVTLSFFRLGKMCRYDLIFYILFQIAGGTVAVYIMQGLMGDLLIAAPVNSVATVPGKAGVWPAAMIELMIAFITMTMVLFTGDHPKWKAYTRIIAACFVCAWVIIAGPISGFGMNPARSFASALPANTWTAFWIYLLMPVAGMLAAVEYYLLVMRRKKAMVDNRSKIISLSEKPMKPFEFVLQKDKNHNEK